MCFQALEVAGNCPVASTIPPQVDAAGTYFRKRAAGTVESHSRRLPYTSKNRVEFRGDPRTPVETTDGTKHRRRNELSPEVARHQ